MFSQNLIKKIKIVWVLTSQVSYLSNCISQTKQKININQIFSNKRKIIHGVPQGSRLRPLLFKMYINDITRLIPEVYMVLNAADTTFGCMNTNFGLKTKQTNAILWTRRIVNAGKLPYLNQT